MRWLAPWLALSTIGCGAHWLPTTIFHVPLDPEVTEPADGDWLALAHEAPGPHASAVAATASVDEGEWIVWTSDDDDTGMLVRVRRTALGLEAQSVGEHRGPRVRPTIRALHVDGGLVIVVESSTAPTSTERDAWLYTELDARIVPLALEGSPARLRVRGESARPIERGWARAAVQTATFEAGARAILVHEHESVREIAADHPELGERSRYEVERARSLTLARGQLWADGPSLFDEPR